MALTYRAQKGSALLFVLLLVKAVLDAREGVPAVRDDVTPLDYANSPQVM